MTETTIICDRPGCGMVITAPDVLCVEEDGCGALRIAYLARKDALAPSNTVGYERRHVCGSGCVIGMLSLWLEGKLRQPLELERAFEHVPV